MRGNPLPHSFPARGGGDIEGDQFFMYRIKDDKIVIYKCRNPDDDK
jgi:hypothetical protein